MIISINLINLINDITDGNQVRSWDCWTMTLRASRRGSRLQAWACVLVQKECRSAGVSARKTLLTESCVTRFLMHGLIMRICAPVAFG